MITLYARQEPTNDPIIRTHFPESKRRDTVIYWDRQCTRPKARIPWHHKGRPISRKIVTLNCYQWRLHWLPSLKNRKP